MSKYNLDSQYFNIGKKRFSGMLISRLENEQVLSEEYHELDGKSYSWKDEVQEKLEKLAVKISDCCNWIEAAAPLYSANEWDSLVGNYGIDQFSHKELTGA